MNTICPKCQTENISTAKFCKKCGSPLIGIETKELSEIEKRVAEEKLYEQVAIDVKNGIRKEGLYAKALVDASGSSELAHALYIKYAVQSIQDEIILRAEAAETVFLAKQLDEKMQQEKEQIKIEEQLTEQQDLIEKPYEPETERWDIITFVLVLVVVIVVVIVVISK